MFLEKCYLSKKSLSAVALMCAVLNTTVYSMDLPKPAATPIKQIGNHQVLREPITVIPQNLQPIKMNDMGKQLYLPDRSYAQKAINAYTQTKGSYQVPQGGAGKQGANSWMCYTTDGRYVIKIAIDEKRNSNDSLVNLENTINSVEATKGRKVAGFDIILPLQLFDIECTIPSTRNTGSAIQIFPNAMDSKLLEIDRSDVGGIIRNYLKWNPDNSCSILREKNETLYLNIMRDLGKKLAEIQQYFEIKRDKRNEYYIGIQHGDFNFGNIFIKNINEDGTANFALIDNEDFRTDGRLVSEIIYFVYNAGKVLLSEPELINIDDQDTRNRVKKLIENLYSGYVNAFSSDVNSLGYKIVKEMKDKVFTNKDNPLFVAKSEGAYSSRYAKGFEEFTSPQNKWKDLLDEYQYGAFTKAYDEKYGTINWSDQKIKSNETDPMGLCKLEIKGNLENLDLSNNPNIKFVDALGQLDNHKNLKTLNLSATSVEDVSTLSSLKNLTSLDLSNNKKLMDVKALGTLTNLTTLNLSGTSIWYFGVLDTLTNLTTLDLSNTKVDTNNGVLGELDDDKELKFPEILPLSNLTKLKSLILTGTNVTPKTVDKLRGQLPGCTITR